MIFYLTAVPSRGAADLSIVTPCAWLADRSDDYGPLLCSDAALAQTDGDRECRGNLSGVQKGHGLEKLQARAGIGWTRQDGLVTGGGTWQMDRGGID